MNTSDKIGTHTEVRDGTDTETEREVREMVTHTDHKISNAEAISTEKFVGGPDHA